MKKRQKWKFYGMIGSLCFLLVSFVATLTIVLAAMRQSVGTQISINYVSEQVAGVITASYQIKNESEVAMVDKNGNDKIVLTGAESSNNELSLAPTDSIEFTSENNSVVFKYSFTNTGDADYLATVSNHDGLNNLTMEISKDGENYSSINDNSIVVFNNTSEPENFYVRYTITDIAKNVDADIAFSWNLKSIDKETAAIVNGEEYESLEDALLTSSLYTIKNVADSDNDEYKIINVLKDSELSSQVSVTENLILYSQKDITITGASDSIFNLEDGANLLLGMPYDTAKVTYACSGSVVRGIGVVELNSSAIASGASSDSGGIIYVDSGMTFVMNGGFLRDGTAINGGAVYVASGGTFEMNGGIIDGCTATNCGGAIFVASGGQLNLYGGRISANTCTDGNGGAVYVAGTGLVTLSGNSASDYMSIDNNSAVIGGAIYCESGTSCTIENYVTIWSNTASNYGGAIYSPSINIHRATIFSNSAELGGGAIYIPENGTCTISGSANIYSNETKDGPGGAIYNSGTLTVNDGFLFKNTSVNNTNGGMHGGAIYNSGTCTISGGEMYANSGETTEVGGGSGGAVYNAGTLLMTGGSIGVKGQAINDNTDLHEAVTVASNATFTMTGGTIGYGTIGLVVYGELNLYGNAQIINNTYIGIQVWGGTVNLGYYTYSGDTTEHTHEQFTGSVSNNGDSISSSDSSKGSGIFALNKATVNVYAGSISNNANAGIYVYNSTMFMAGSTPSISNNYRGVHLHSYGNSTSSFEFIGGSISNNTCTDGNGGGIYVDGTSSVTLSELGGSYHSRIQGNSAVNGGAIYLENGASCTIESGAAISSNTATYCGGVYINSNASCSMTGGAVSQNSDDGNYAGIYCEGNLTLSGGSIDNNASYGVYVTNGSFTMESGTITTDSDQIYGVFVLSNGTFTMNGGSITGSGNGSGVYISKGTFVMNSGSISGNGDGAIYAVGNTSLCEIYGDSVLSDPLSAVNLYSGATLKLGYYTNKDDTTEHTHEQFTGSISGGANGIMATNSIVNIYAGNISNCGSNGVYAISSTINMSGSGHPIISENNRGVYLEGTSENPSSFSFIGGYIKDNTCSDGNGGGVYVGANCSFTTQENAPYYTPYIQNNEAKNGGGVYVDPNGSCYLGYGSIMWYNKAEEYGGAVYAGDSNNSTLVTDDVVEIYGAFIDGNSASLGGALYARYVKVSLHNGYIGGRNNGNFAGNGGAFFITNGLFEMTDGEIFGNEGNGGALYLAATKADISGGKIYSNSQSYIGAIYISHANNLSEEIVTISGNVEIYNNGGGMMYGGAIYVNNNGESRPGVLHIAGGKIYSNSSVKGGAIFNNGGNITVSGGSIYNNTAFGDYDTEEGQGGAIYNNGTLTVTGGYIYGNEVSSDETYPNSRRGGAIYNMSTLSITGGYIGTNESGEILGNSAINGGGVFSTTAFTMSGGNIVNNTATASGGGVYVTNGFTMTGGTIEGNTATSQGGGIFGLCALTINTATSKTAVSISSNNAETGAGIFCGGASSTAVNISGYDISMASNVATGNGGAIYCFGGQITINGSSADEIYIYNNSAAKGGGIFASRDSSDVGSNVNIYRTLIKSNQSSAEGGGMVVYLSRLTLNSGAKIHENVVNTSNSSAYGGGLSINESYVLFGSGCEVSNNIVGGSSKTYSGAGVQLDGAATECYIRAGAAFHNNHFADGVTSGVGGNMFANYNVKKVSMQGGTFTGDGDTEQAELGGGLAFYCQDGDDIGKINIHGAVEFKNCVAAYGGAIAAVGKFSMYSTTDYGNPSISGCVATSGIGNAIWAADQFKLDGNVSISGDIALGSNESSMTSDITLSSYILPYRTASIVAGSSLTGEYELSLFKFSVSVALNLSISYTVSADTSYMDNFYKSDSSTSAASYALITGNSSLDAQSKFTFKSGLGYALTSYISSKGGWQYYDQSNDWNVTLTFVSEVDGEHVVDIYSTTEIYCDVFYGDYYQTLSLYIDSEEYRLATCDTMHECKTLILTDEQGNSKTIAYDEFDVTDLDKSYVISVEI